VSIESGSPPTLNKEIALVTLLISPQEVAFRNIPAVPIQQSMVVKMKNSVFFTYPYTRKKCEEIAIFLVNIFFP